jgi:hypothetical protein
MLLIYGQYDPWSGGAMEAPLQPTSARYFVPAATHGAQIAQLGAAEQTQALDLAATFFDEAPQLGQMRRAAAAATARSEWIAGKLLRHRLRLPR